MSICLRLSASSGQSLEEINSAYRLSERDQVASIVFGEPALEAVQRVDASGRINLPLIGPIEVRGMTLSEAEARIEAAYVEEEILRKPEVTLMIKEYASKGASVLGQVLKPGRVEFPPEMNAMDLVDLISRAGGFTGIAKSTAVHVTAIKDGKEVTRQVDVDRLIRGQNAKGGGGDPSERNVVIIFPDDVIFVPESLF